jgi:hypothetical protein
MRRETPNREAHGAHNWLFSIGYYADSGFHFHFVEHSPGATPPQTVRC